MASSSSLFIRIDESTKSTKRSFVEIEIGGQLYSTDPDLHIWCVPLTVKEVVSHSAEKMIELILSLSNTRRVSGSTDKKKAQSRQPKQKQKKRTHSKNSWLKGNKQ